MKLVNVHLSIYFKLKLYTTQKFPGQAECMKAETHIATMLKLQHVYVTGEN